MWVREPLPGNVFDTEGSEQFADKAEKAVTRYRAARFDAVVAPVLAVPGSGAGGLDFAGHLQV